MTVLDRFQPDPDGVLLAAESERWLAQSYVPDPSGFSTGMWRQMAGFGWPAMRLPEASGGLALQLSACLPLVNALGATGVREPIVESALIAAPLAARAGAPDDFLAALATGERICAVMDDPAAPVSGGDEITDLLVFAPRDDRLLLCARSEVPGPVWQSMDGGRMADRERRPASGSVLLTGAPARAAVALAGAERAACLAALGCGAMARALSLAATYLTQRHQFGQPLAQFQVLQHRLADMQVDLELTRSMAATLVPGDGPPPAAIGDRARAQICTALRRVGEAGVHLHGGMGMTDEMEIGRVFKRLLHIAALLGGESAPRNRLAGALARRTTHEH